MSVPEPVAPESAPAHRFHMWQKLTLFQNVYVVYADQAGEPGAVVAFAKQKRMAFREQFTIFADEAATRPVLRIQANRRLDINSVMTVSNAATGAVIGTLRKKGRRSLFRSTWELAQPGMPVVTVQERNSLIAFLRRVWGFIPIANSIPVPWVFHFDGESEGIPVLSHVRLWGIRDRYVLQIHSPALDPWLAIALAVCLDAMQNR